jgi:hypothetical protein
MKTLKRADNDTPDTLVSGLPLSVGSVAAQARPLGCTLVALRL